MTKATKSVRAQFINGLAKRYEQRRKNLALVAKATKPKLATAR
jgi:hypothetical protein